MSAAVDAFQRPLPASAKTGAVTVVQPYVPAYRVPLFEELCRQLGRAGLRLEVAHGGPEVSMASRGDARSGGWSAPIRARRLSFRGRTLTYRHVLRRARRSTFVIAELASTNIDTYLLALDPRVRLMLWGHGRSYVTKPSRLDARLELWLARRAENVFVYTEGGADYLRSRGYDPRKITVVRNSTDTVALRAAASALGDQELDEYRQEHDLGRGHVAAFIGSFDDSKLLPLLFEAMTLVHSLMPDLRLIVAGAGTLQPLVDAEAARHPFVRLLPRAELDELARIGRVSSCVVVPGRVGLVAVDALALGLPLVTTSFRYHAPEAEYLTDEVRLVADQTPEAFAHQVVALLGDPVRLATASAAATALGKTLSIESMASAFTRTLLKDEQ